MTHPITNLRNDQLRDYVESLRARDIGVGDLPIESDRDVYRLLAAIDRFRMMDDDPFDFSDPDQEPTSEIMREIATALISPDNTSIVDGFYERHCRDVAMNPFAQQTWCYLRARQRMAKQASGCEGEEPRS